MTTWNRSTGCPTHNFSLVVCKHPTATNPCRWLAVEECKNRGWWLPGGFVENGGDDFYTTAIKETIEEAGIHIEIKGILRVEHSMSFRRDGARQRVIFYAEPKHIDKIEPKSIPDEESLRAKWLSIKELQELSTKSPPFGLRGHELLDWATYIENGGTIYPTSILTNEHTPIPVPDT